LTNPIGEGAEVGDSPEFDMIGIPAVEDGQISEFGIVVYFWGGVGVGCYFAFPYRGETRKVTLLLWLL
jgi:hypothetical protein